MFDKEEKNEAQFEEPKEKQFMESNETQWNKQRRLFEEKYRTFAQSLEVSGDTEHPVFGEGEPTSRLLLIGEAPGAQEAQEGRPFVGKAGKQLRALLEQIGLNREEIYMTNAVKYRPIKKGKNANRTPMRKEIDASRPFLFEEMASLHFDWIATLGNSALYALTNDISLRIGDCHGTSIKTDFGTLVPLYHPASVIYNRSLQPVYEADLMALASRIQNE